MTLRHKQACAACARVRVLSVSHQRVSHEREPRETQHALRCNLNTQTMEELEHMITKEWAATDLNFIARICRNMPHRLQQVISNHGHKIPY